ncbi:SDR family NAD(P)-dependent oxidoreductase [Legionella taurinensis]|uniref:SDR family NAD(P)-dependent oxidoreductase n=1 Tax=Legionella taurinensis TaxID=70611 RepID=A0A3A5LGA2_9GAMM|nr:SDR family oxidoreductase [Legionella taurinensis]MDX1838253.1 SDR family oxidoreductase [Legionella taurinensis]PUT39255.1 short-chain dehydrogenase [Legionella taurinensis]PUT40601.1 short-chain dehydrogenase [Legionella taurinensis]PUT44021.1 short-chain dehydrogenase [Legionella taurinensis]PUT46283.1 short-chain dehydrogenase [Legionella taurinensis]
MRTLITGASRGIGQALAFEFARQGHDVVLVARDEPRLNELAATLRLKFGIQADIVAMDLSRPGSAQYLINALEAKQLDIECLINNAGIGCLADFVDMDGETVNATMQLNMVCLTELTHHYAVRFSKLGRGKILQVASTAGFQPGPRMSVYYATKAYVISLSVALAYELKPQGVTVSILCPGPTESAFMERAHMQGSWLARGIIGLMSAEKVARKAYSGLNSNQLFIIPGIMNKILVFAAKLSPRFMSTRIVAFFHRKQV